MNNARSPWSALAALLVGYFVVVVDMTVVAVANPVIVDDLGADVGQVVWATSAYLLTFAALLLPAGRLGDHVGQRNVYLGGLALFTAASLACGLSPTIEILIGSRAVQGVGAALIAPQAMAAVTRLFPVERRGAAMSLWGAVSGLANLVGPIMGGALADTGGWQWVFFINVPLGVAGLALAAKLVPALPGTPHRFDVRGMALSTAGMVLLVVGIQEGGPRGWDAASLGAIAVGTAVLAVFAVHQHRSAGEPLMPLDIFRSRNFTLTAVAVALAAAAVSALLVPLYFYLEEVRDLSGTSAGLVFAPMAVLAIICVPVAGILADRAHPRVIPLTGCALFAATIAVFSVFMTPDSPLAVFLLGAAIAGVANACIWPALAATATRGLPDDRAGVGAGAYNAIRQVGAALGTAAIGAVMVQRIGAHGLDPGLADGATDALTEPARTALGDALGESIFLPVLLLLAGTAACALIVRGGVVAEPEPELRVPSADAR